MAVWGIIASAISDATHRPFGLRSRTPVGGGSINESFRLTGDDGSFYFLKLNDAPHHAMFIAEAAGLDAIASTRTLRVPRPVAHGIAGRQSYLVLEHLELDSRGDARLLGEQLAAMHRHSFALPARERVEFQASGNNVSTPSPTLPLQGGGSGNAANQFGFSQDNFIGTTPQPNMWSEDWITFWRDQRLGFQLQLAAKNGYGGQLQGFGERLLDALPGFFGGYTPRPSLLHGDLWGGNHAYLTDGTPAIFDPACYYGDRECDLAMTELFGGYPASFYAAYRAAWPLDAGYATRRDLYNLYHVLNHANLFGGGYVRQAEQMAQRLLFECG
jgi:fructosamine-3-kinase